jgi:hypothetical protein
MVDQGTKGRARDERLASGGHLARRDVWVPYREGTLQHRDFLHGMPLIEARMMRIMFVLDRSFKAMECGARREYFCRAKVRRDRHNA